MHIRILGIFSDRTARKNRVTRSEPFFDKNAVKREVKFLHRRTTTTYIILLKSGMNFTSIYNNELQNRIK